MLHNVLVARSRKNFSQCVLCTNFLALYFMMVFIGENTCGVTKNISFFILASYRSCVLHNLLVALSRYKLAICILRDGWVCAYFSALY